MNILVVNDDGYLSPKLKLLASSFNRYGNVYIVAPHIEQSGASSSITVHKGLKVHKHEENLWSVEGTPSDCVKFALFGLGLNIDLVVSGINNGLNIGLDTIYSGTVGACMEALIYGKSAVAFSNEYHLDVNLIDLEHVIKVIMDQKLYSIQYVLNVNFPKNNAKGIIVTQLGIKEYEHYYELNEGIYLAKRISKDILVAEHTDLWAVENDYISITPLKLGNGDQGLTNLVKAKIKC